MKRRARDWTPEEYDVWSAASGREEAVAEAADEEGGPRLSLVPLKDRDEAWPTDLLPERGAQRSSAPVAEATRTAGRRVAERARSTSSEWQGAECPASRRSLRGSDRPCHGPVTEPPLSEADPPQPATPFDGVPLEDSRKRRAGWCAERQRLFLVALAETGSVHLAAAAARLSARSAYSLRARSPAFAAGWDTADQLAVGRLSALAFDRAIHGRTEQVWHEGVLVAEKRVPSDKLLMWLLARLDPRRFAAPWELRGGDAGDPQAEARQSFLALLDALADIVSE
jgi:hypothetical protein